MLYRIITQGDMLSDPQLQYFSSEAIEYLYRFYDDTGNIQYDPVAICCDWNEGDPADIKNDYRNLDEIRDSRTLDELITAINKYSFCSLLPNGNIIYMCF